LLSIETGEKRRVTTPPATSLGDVGPAFSPDGQKVAFVRVQQVGLWDIYLAPAGGGDPKQLTFDGRWIGGLVWTPDGRGVVFSSQGWMWRISASGGEPDRIAGVGGNALLPAISRGGQRLAFWRVEAPDPKGAPKPATKLIASTRLDSDPEYSPDGKRIAFTSGRSGSNQVWVCDSDGSNPVQLTSFSGPGASLSSWSPDGQYIAFNSILKGNFDIYVTSARGGVARQLTTHSALDARPSWSRDGRWIYFASNRTGAWQVWKIPSEGGTPVQVTKNGGYRALESVDGRFIYYTKDQGVDDAWRVPVEGGEEVLVLGNLQTRWSVVERGLYFFDREESAATGAKWFIKFFDFEAGEVRPIVALDKGPETGGAPAVSPDGRSFLYWREDVGEADLMLVENFR
jgi:Tol biopolymer transport system component